MSAGNAQSASGGTRGESVLPATFAKRGVYLPFTTTVLGYARLRRPQAGSLEILIPGLAGAGQTYIIPHKVLPEIINLTVHDRALHEELATARKITPSSIRVVANRIAVTGLGGPALAKRARQEKEAEARQPTLILFNLILMAISQLAPTHPGISELNEKSIATPDGMKLARDALGGYAQSIGERGDKIYTRLENWAKVISPVGSPDESIVGYLLTFLRDLEALAESLGKWLIQEPTETAEMAQRTAIAARNIAKTARKEIGELNVIADHMADPLRDFDTVAGVLKEKVERISLVLNGWQRVIDNWDLAVRGDRFFQRDTLETFAQHLPVLPEEAVGADGNMWRVLRESQSRWSRTSQHRLDGDIDQDTKKKLSRFRKEPG